MDTGNLTVAGRRFRAGAEYEAALRDERKIKEIKRRYDFQDRADVLKLYKELQAGNFSFESLVGDDFDDEIFDLVEKLKAAPVPEDAKKGGKQRSAVTTGPKSRLQAKKAVQGGNRAQSKQAATLENLDQEMQKEVLAVMKKKEKRRRLIILGCSLLAVASFTYYGIYYFYTIRTERNLQEMADLRNSAPQYDRSQEKVVVYKTGAAEMPDILAKYQEIYNKNKKLIGWLEIADTIINYPVMQTVNNEYYLDHNANQEYDKNGSIFMDYQCLLYPRSDNLIIYGHHMKSGKMFGDLQKYVEESYYREHPVIDFDTIYEEGTYEIMYVFRSRVYNEEEIVFKYYQFFDANSAEEFDSNMREMAKMSLYQTGVTANYGDQLLTLSTCDNSQSDGRFVVVAKRVS